MRAAAPSTPPPRTAVTPHPRPSTASGLPDKSPTYRFVSSPKYGRLQYQMTYSYLTRKAWSSFNGTPTATNNMVFTGLRYYIP